MAEKTAKYRLKPGKKHWVGSLQDTRLAKEGEVVDLTPAQALNWRDKFEPVDAPKPAPVPEPPKDPDPEKK